MNSYAVTGKPDPCPNCGSEDVRWRGRRFYDVIATNVRGFVDWFLASLLRSSPRGGTALAGTDRYDQHEFVSARYEARRAAYDYKMAFLSPDRYWSCAGCGKRGQVYGNVDSAMAMRGELAQLEDRLSDLDPTTDIAIPVDREGTAHRQ